MDGNCSQSSHNTLNPSKTQVTFQENHGILTNSKKLMAIFSLYTAPVAVNLILHAYSNEGIGNIHGPLSRTTAWSPNLILVNEDCEQWVAHTVGSGPTNSPTMANMPTSVGADALPGPGLPWPALNSPSPGAGWGSPTPGCQNPAAPPPLPHPNPPPGRSIDSPGQGPGQRVKAQNLPPGHTNIQTSREGRGSHPGRAPNNCPNCSQDLTRRIFHQVRRICVIWLNFGWHMSGLDIRHFGTVRTHSNPWLHMLGLLKLCMVCLDKDLYTNRQQMCCLHLLCTTSNREAA